MTSYSYFWRSELHPCWPDTRKQHVGYKHDGFIGSPIFNVSDLIADEIYTFSSMQVQR